MAMIAGPVAAETVDEQRMRAAAIEWTVANCGAEGVNAFNVSFAMMVINGQHGDAMDVARASVRDRIDATFSTPTDACPDLIASSKDGPTIEGN